MIGHDLSRFVRNATQEDRRFGESFPVDLFTLTLKDAPGNGTLLKVVESGFDNVPPARRLEAFRMNNRGWEYQLNNIASHASA